MLIRCTVLVALCLTFSLSVVATVRAQPTSPPNVLLICIDDLRPELASFGQTYIHSPHIDRLAARGRAFDRHYVQAPTCGASRYAMLTGRYGPSGNGALFERARGMADDPQKAWPTMPGWFRSHGYTTVSVGKVSHHPGGRGGPDWDDDKQLEMPASWDRHLMPTGAWQHPRGAMHGLAHGEIRVGSGTMDVYQAEPGDDTNYPDGLIADEAIRQIDVLTDDHDQPFFLAVGFIRPHLPFGAPAQYLEPYLDAPLPPIPHPGKPEGLSTWHGSGEFRRYNLGDRDPNEDPEFAMQVRKHYAASVTYVDALVGRVIQELEDRGAADNTIVVLWGDHGWHLGEHAIWGKHALFEESLRSPLIVVSPEMAQPGVFSHAVVETIDIFPTLCGLTGLGPPDSVQGASLEPILQTPEATSRGAAVSYRGNDRTLRTETHRLIVHRDGQRELYDHTTDPDETHNLADTEPALADQLEQQLNARLVEVPAQP